VRLARVVAPVLVVGAAAFAAGCDGDSGGDPETETEAPPPIGGSPREAVPPSVENATPEALAACGYPPGQAVPPADSPEAESLEACLRAIRGYPDPLRAPVDLVRTELAVPA
jgi:hypothetical protein